MAYARKAVKGFGLKASQFPDLVRLWNRESGWNVKATNPSSGATGIPQLLPGQHPVPAGWEGKNAVKVQVDWGLNYIKQRYGSIAAAWAHEQHFGWY
jgi:SLT domain-containing protein